MIFSGFRLRLIFRVGLLVGVLFVLIYSAVNTSWVITPIVLSVLVIIQLGELIYFLEGSIRELSNFLLSIKHRDFSGTYSESRRGKSNPLLQTAFKEINTAFKEISTQKELHYLYLQTIVDHVGVALICYKPGGEITLMNDAASQLLQLPHLSNINSLKRVDTQLPEQIKSLEPGHKTLVKLNIANSFYNLSIYATVFKLDKEEYKLISLQNIRSELEGREVIAWQKLIRVLNHEIMNSVTPIISLSGIIHKKLGENINLIGIELEVKNELTEILKGIGTIENRSKGLLNFVKNYRSLTSIKEPNFKKVEVEVLFDRLMQLLFEELKRMGITLKKELPFRNLVLEAADIELLEQVLINLILNSRDALKGRTENSEILLSAEANGQKVKIVVADNGSGISPENLENIFTPFFSTKKNGSGIGLSLSRQIIFLHNGTISVNSELGKYTYFRLEL